jgi:dTDP-4-amino-4,6-dideoxygalactose transaminase
MPDVAAAIGRAQLRKAEIFLEKRRQIAKFYSAGLGNLDFIEVPAFTSEHSWHIYMIRIVESRLELSRDEFIAALSRKGIGTSVHFIPLHIMPYYRDRYGFREEDFPASMARYRTSISLPIYPSLSEHETARVVEAIKEIGYSACKR